MMFMAKVMKFKKRRQRSQRERKGNTFSCFLLSLQEAQCFIIRHQIEAISEESKCQT